MVAYGKAMLKAIAIAMLPPIHIKLEAFIRILLRYIIYPIIEAMIPIMQRATSPV